MKAGGALIIVLAILTSLAACVPVPEDPLDFGTLCIPASADCPSFQLLDRPYTGRNQVDYVLENTGSTVAVIEVLALVPSATVDAGFGATDPDSLVARREISSLQPGDRAEDRFTAQDLGIREEFRFGMRCLDCEAELQWVYASVPRECVENNDCPATWLCDDNLGRCVECLATADCNDDQRCDLATGRCDPRDTTAGCDTAGGGLGLASFLLFAALLASRGRRRRLSATLLVALLVVVDQPAEASPPHASVAVGSGARFITGDLGPLTQRGVGLMIGQELRWRHIGAGLTLGTSYFLTRQEPPPFSRSLQTYGATLGPRMYLPIRFFELVVGADYRRIGTANNSLIRFTGRRTSFHGVGGFGGVRLRWSGLEIRFEGGGHYLVPLDSTMIAADVSIGFTNAR